MRRQGLEPRTRGLRVRSCIRFLSLNWVNQAELDLRPPKTQQKISGRLRSEAATRDLYAIRGYPGTTAASTASPSWT